MLRNSCTDPYLFSIYYYVGEFWNPIKLELLNDKLDFVPNDYISMRVSIYWPELVWSIFVHIFVSPGGHEQAGQELHQGGGNSEGVQGQIRMEEGH